MTIEFPVSVELFSAIKYSVNGILAAILSDILLLAIRRWADDCDIRRRGYLTKYYRGNRFLRAGSVQWNDMTYQWLVLLLVALALVAAEFAVEFGSGAQNAIVINKEEAWRTDAKYSPPKAPVFHTHVMDRDFLAGMMLMNCSHFKPEGVGLKTIMYKPINKGKTKYHFYCDGEPISRKPFRDIQFYPPYMYKKTDVTQLMSKHFETLSNTMRDNSPQEEYLTMMLSPRNLFIKSITYANINCEGDIKLVSNQLFAGDQKLATCLMWMDKIASGSVEVYPGSCLFYGADTMKLLVTGDNVPRKPSHWKRSKIGSGKYDFNLQGNAGEDRFRFFPLVSFRSDVIEEKDVMIMLISTLERATHKSDLTALNRRIVGFLTRDVKKEVDAEHVFKKKVDVGKSVIRPTIDEWVVWLVLVEFVAIIGGMMSFLLAKDCRWNDLREMDNLAYYWWHEKEQYGDKLEGRAVVGIVKEDSCLRVTSVAGEDILSCAPPAAESLVIPFVPPRGRFCVPCRRGTHHKEVVDESFAQG